MDQESQERPKTKHPEMKIQSTKEYHRFLSPRIQRGISQENVNAIKESMSRRGWIESKHITVREDGSKYRIIFGQHRFQAARDLDLPIIFTIDNSLTDEDAIEADRHAVWNRADTIEAWAASGNSHYSYLLKFARHHGITTSTAATLLSGNAAQSNSGNWSQYISGGLFVVANQQYAQTVVEMAKAFEPYVSWWNEGLFIRGIAAMLNIPGFDMEVLKRRLPANVSKLTKRRTLREYVGMIEEIYNSRAKAQDCLSIAFLYEQHLRNTKARNIEKKPKARLVESEPAKQQGLLSRILGQAA
jgi:hypothetical protein